MKRRAALVVCVWAVAGPLAAMPLDELLRRHTEARGGRAAIEAVQRLEIDLHITEPTFQVTGLYRVDRAGRMRIDVFSDGSRVFSEAYHGTGAWQWAGGDPHGKDVTPEGEAALRHSGQLPVNLLGLHELAARGARLTPLGRRSLDGIRYHVLQLRLPDGFEVEYFLHPRTFQIERSRDRRPLHPDVDNTPTVLETRWSDFRPVAGVLRAFRSETIDTRTGKTVSTTLLKDVRVNPAFPPNLFARP